jgi:hypothetical protein
MAVQSFYGFWFAILPLSSVSADAATAMLPHRRFSRS